MEKKFWCEVCGIYTRQVREAPPGYNRRIYHGTWGLIDGPIVLVPARLVHARCGAPVLPERPE